MNILKSLLILLIIVAISAAAVRSDAAQWNDMEKNMIDMYNSRDFKTRITAFFLTSEINSESLRKYLRKIEKTKKGIELAAILYALNTPSSTEENEEKFIKAVPNSSFLIKELLKIDSGESSYIKGAPYLHIIEMLGRIARRSDTALKKLIKIYRYSDGWAAEVILSLIEEAKEYRLKQKLHR